MTIDLMPIIEKTKVLWEAYDALGQLVPIDDPAHHLLKRLNPDFKTLYVDLLLLYRDAQPAAADTEIQSAASGATSALYPVPVAAC
jgi:hypothetical protein